MSGTQPVRLRITANLETVRSINDLVEQAGQQVTVESLNERSPKSQLDFDLGELADIVTLISTPVLLRELAHLLAAGLKKAGSGRVQLETALDRLLIDDPVALSIEEVEEALRRLLGESGDE